MEKKNKKREFIVFQFKLLNELHEQIERYRVDLYPSGEFGYFEELIFDPDAKSKDLLDNDKILLFIVPQEFKVWLWVGCNTAIRLQSDAEKASLPIREKYGTDLPRGVIPYFLMPGVSLESSLPQPPISILRCTKCGFNKIEIRKEEYPLCVRCGYSGGDFMTSYP